MAHAEWFPIDESPINYRIDSRMRRQATAVEDITSASKDVPVIDGTPLLKQLAFTQDSTTAIRQSSSSLALPLDTSAISLNSCIFIHLKIAIVIGISDPLTCSKICARNAECTHITHEPFKSGGTCTLHKAPGLDNDWSAPAPQRSGATCGRVPKKRCVSQDGSLISLCLDLGLSIALGLL
ncbi:hypothetical protein GHT06_010385 [Daphnia sinensis]|uniref:Apple domain-containing protein n=1 Tax=Daphnia sinensis TaxID=1820382 RepID=A0AAD5L0D0_9CRUS|nr:hypothetical protein GHT06_010385 [Daphnia sinensis]